LEKLKKSAKKMLILHRITLTLFIRLCWIPFGYKEGTFLLKALFAKEGNEG
jgi:hypothetical protein